MSVMKVFVSYCHDPLPIDAVVDRSDRDRRRTLHCAHAVNLSNYLRHRGIDCRIDQYYEDDPPNSWPQWMERQIVECDYVLMVCTPSYFHYVTQEADEGSQKGLGSRFEGRIIYGCLTKEPTAGKFIPIFFGPRQPEYIPRVIAQSASYQILFPLDMNSTEQRDLWRLYAKLTRQTQLTVTPEPTQRRDSEGKMLEEGAVKVARVRVNVIGQDGVGKTCLVRLLLGEKFEEQASTCGIDFSKASVTMVKSHSSVAEGDAFQWRLLSHKEHKEMLNQMYGSAERKLEKQTEEHKNTSELFPNSSDSSEDDKVDKPLADNPSKLAQEHRNQIQEIVDDPTRIGNQSRVSLMTISDFGGQEPFLTAHAALMPSGALSMYVLVFNGAELLSDKAKSVYRQNAEDGHIISLDQTLCRMKTNKDFLKHWSSSVHVAHSPQLTSSFLGEAEDVNFPPIFLVATHRRKAEATRGTAVDVIQKNNDSVDAIFSGENVQGHFIYPSQSDNNFFLVENETSGTADEDPTAREIRGEVNKMSNSFWKKEKEQPARWLKFEDVLGELKSITKRSVSEIEEIREVAKICCIPSDGEESELKEALVHLTNVGAAFYFPEVSFLEKFVFHDTQWLVHVLASFFGSAHSKPKQAKARTDWQKAKQSGHLSSYLVNYLLKQAEVEERDYESAKGILRHFDVLVEKEDGHFAPCFLQNNFDGETQYDKSFSSGQDAFPLPLVISARDVLCFPEPLFFRLAARIISSGEYFKKAPTNMSRNRLVFPLRPVGGVNAEFLYLGIQNCICLTVFSETERGRPTEAQLVSLRQRCSELRQWIIASVDDAKKRGMPGLQTEFYCQVRERKEGDKLQNTLAEIEGFSADEDSWHLVDETKHVVDEELRRMKVWFGAGADTAERSCDHERERTTAANSESSSHQEFNFGSVAASGPGAVAEDHSFKNISLTTNVFNFVDEKRSDEYMAEVFHGAKRTRRNEGIHESLQKRPPYTTDKRNESELVNVNRKPTTEELQGVADRIVKDWKHVARKLDIDENEIKRIDVNEREAREKPYQMLLYWMESKSESATVDRLCQALRKERKNKTSGKETSERTDSKLNVEMMREK
ncbi:uncharacterized protein [Oscarella lobularis]|uniref:uncharacterized protein isoform X3 n=1 Tax=Oscarella lobularis TaxID=121494 RepID=UPI003313145D